MINNVLFYLKTLRRLGMDGTAYPRLNFGGFSKFVPYTTYALDPTEILHILNEVVINQRKCVLELGTGTSTIYLARLAKANNMDIQIISVDHNADYQEVIKQFCAGEGTASHIQFLHAPINEEYNWYDKKVILGGMNNRKVDMVIIDGPPKINGDRNIRANGKTFIEQLLSDSYSIFIDNADRPEERELANRICDFDINKRRINFEKYSLIYTGEWYESNPYT